jgi:hypothetical protein
MRRYPMLCVLALIPLLAMISLPAPSQAQGSAGSTDFADGSAIARRT